MPTNVGDAKSQRLWSPTALSMVLIGGLATRATAVSVEGDTWFPLGPAPIQNFFGGGVTGRATAIAINPANPDHVWIGGASGGVWASRDGGHSWVPITDNQPALAIGALAVDNCDASGCDTIYAGTGENAIRRDTYYGRGLLEFDDVGEFPSWQLHAGTPFEFALGSINDVVLDPSTSGTTKRIFVTLSSGTTSSTAQATVTAPQPSGGYGIYRSDDDGRTWTKLILPGSVGARPTDLDMDPADPKVLYAGILGVGAFKTTDGGNSWCPLNDGIARPQGCPNPHGLAPDVAGGFDHVEIAIQPTDSNRVYITFGHCADRLIQTCTPSVFRTTNGNTWEKRHMGTTSGSITACPAVYSRYTHALAVHPTLGDVLLLGGGRICRSTDGGVTFAASDNNLAPGGSPWGPILHLDHHEVVFHPADANRAYSTDDGGFASSTNGGIDWTPGNRDLPITGFYSLTSSPNTPRVLGGAQDNSGQLWTGFRTWNHVGDGDGGYTAIDLDNPMILYLGSNFGAIERSTNGGTTFSTLSLPSSSATRAFNSPFVQDPAPGHALYHGADSLFRSVDDGATWTQVSPILATGVTDEIVPLRNVITAIGVQGTRIYVGYYGGQVFTTNAACNALGCWTDVSAGLPAAPLTDIAVDPTNGNIAYLAVGGFASTAHVWKTTTAGGSWIGVATGLPSGVPTTALAIEPDATSRIWAGLDSSPQGSSVFRSTDGGVTWAARGVGLPNAPVHDLSVDATRGRIYAGLHGRGAYVLGRPVVGNFEGWVMGSIWDIPIFGQSFPENQTCTVSLLQSTGTVCASATVDVIGGTIVTDGTGLLGTSKNSTWQGKPVVWACLNGRCLGNTPIAECNDDKNGDGVPDLLSTVVVACGGTPGTDTILGCPTLTQPPESLLEVGFFETGSPLSAAASVLAPVRNVTAPSAGSFHVAAVLQSPTGAEELCSVRVEVEPGATPSEVMEVARDAVEASPTCTAAGVVAELDGLLEEEEEQEDKFGRDARLLLSTPDRTGGQIVTGVHVNPGEARGSCFALRGLGNAMLSQLRIMRTTILASPEGAHGGRLTFIESTGLGTCAVTLETRPGQSASDVAQDLVTLVLDSSDPAAKPYCEEAENPRDVRHDGDSVVSVLASALQVCLDDPGLGVAILPKETMSNAPPTCEAARPTRERLWPPNHRPYAVGVDGVTDPDGDRVSITITAIQQDEPVEGSGDGRTSPDGFGIGDASARVRAERSGSGDGRVYHVLFEAQDVRGATCTGEVRVCVPKHASRNALCGDGGPLYDSTAGTAPKKQRADRGGQGSISGRRLPDGGAPVKPGHRHQESGHEDDASPQVGDGRHQDPGPGRGRGCEKGGPC